MTDETELLTETPVLIPLAPSGEIIELRTERDRLLEDNARLREALSTAEGNMLNAHISLDLATKASVREQLKRAIQRVRADLSGDA